MHLYCDCLFFFFFAFTHNLDKVGHKITYIGCVKDHCLG